MTQALRDKRAMRLSRDIDPFLATPTVMAAERTSRIFAGASRSTRRRRHRDPPLATHHGRARSMPRTASTLLRSCWRKRRRAMPEEDDHIARYQRPPRKRGQFNRASPAIRSAAPLYSKNIRTYVNEHLNKKIPIIEGGKRERLRGPRRLRSSSSTRPPKGSLKALPPS